jgi:hypothetical protein
LTAWTRPQQMESGNTQNIQNPENGCDLVAQWLG